MRSLAVFILFFLSIVTVRGDRGVLPSYHEVDLKRSLTVIEEVAVDSERFRPAAEAFVAGVKALGGRLELVDESAAKSGRLVLHAGAMNDVGGQWFRSEIQAGGGEVLARNAAGAAYGVSALLQEIKIDDEGVARLQVGSRFAKNDEQFRCFMIDMGRNPHSPEVVRQMIDAMWLLRVNYLQLHLSDDQFFSWASQAFPKLQSENAGWTRRDFIELEAYSQARGVTIIPELDVPGHSTILRRQYPEVFGETPTDLATKPEALEGYLELVDELLEVFRATPYFHMGGDEAYGVPQEVQRAFINRVNAAVKKRGRRLIVWEGPKEGTGESKVDTDVLQMNWRTIDFPAQRMLDAGYKVVNAAWDPMYIVDHYPRTMFTAVDLQRCYEWDRRRFAHINHEMVTYGEGQIVDRDEGIVGFCMPWWEGREQNMLNLCVPRLAAVSAKAWNREGEQDFESFLERYGHFVSVWQKISGAKLTPMVMVDPRTQQGNLAFGKSVLVSAGQHQPYFSPQRLTNGVTAPVDHFLGFPTKPEPLVITIDLGERVDVSEVKVYETAQGGSWESYEVLVGVDAGKLEVVGETEEESRGKGNFVVHKFERKAVRFVRIRTNGCQGLTFPSFSRLCEVEVR